jgi:predicted TIM-barrel fold metal-dependent hydrolase
MIIDAHNHILPQRRLDGLSIWLGQVFPHHPLAGKPFTVDFVINDLLRKGVNYIFNLVFPMNPSETEELNLFSYDLGKKYHVIIPFGSLHIENENKKGIVRRCIKELGLSGFKLHPYVQGFSPDDRKLYPAYEKMEEFGTVVNIHTGFEVAYPKRKVTITLATMEKLVKKFSTLKIVISHMFYPRLYDAVYLLENYSNVYVDTTNIFSAIVQDEKNGINRDKEREILIDTLQKWSKRSVFGSDHPAGMSDLDTILLDFNSFNLSNDLKRDLLFETANSLVHHVYGGALAEKFI